MRGWRRVLDGVTLGALTAISVALRWPLRAVWPYGDEGTHYYLARHLMAGPTDVSDVAGLTYFVPRWIVWERPLFMLLLHPFAEHGFAAYRGGYILVSSLLAPALWFLVRAHGGHRVTALAAALSAAALPALVTWGVLGSMDELMATLLSLAMAARRLGHLVTSSILFLLSIWAKETAFAVVLFIALVSFTRAWWKGEARAVPLALDRPTTSLVLPLVFGLAPLVLSLATGLDQFGGTAVGYGARLLDQLYVTPWLIPLLLLGLWHRQSRAVCAVALFVSTGYLVSHALLHRSVEAWYVAGAQPLCIAGSALAVEAMLRGTRAGLWRAGASGVAIVAAALVLAMVLLPASAAKGAWLQPATRAPSDSWAGTVRYETLIRDKPLVDAVQALHLDGSRSVVTMDLYLGQSLALTRSARHVYADSARVREVVPVMTGSLVQVLETNGTPLLQLHTDTAMDKALERTYPDCKAFDDGEYRVYEVWRCPGRRARLDHEFAAARPPPT